MQEGNDKCMKKSRGFVLAETLIVSTIIATILVYVFVQFNTIQNKYNESFRYNDVDDLYKLASIKDYINSLSATDINNIITKIASDDIIIMHNEEETYSNISYLDNQSSLLANLGVKMLAITKADINNIDISSFSKNVKSMIKRIDNKSDNYRLIADFNNGNAATITISLDGDQNE